MNSANPSRSSSLDAPDTASLSSTFATTLLIVSATASGVVALAAIGRQAGRHQHAAGIERLVVSTYQAVSGTGKAAGPWDDHAGGLARLQRESGATFVASAADEQAFEAGRFPYGPSKDALFAPIRVDQLIATAFHRNTMTQNEGGTSDEEFRSAAIVDRVNTTLSVWMGTSMACAQCHSHKFDPISQHEYFGVYAILNNTADADRGDESPVARHLA